MTDDSVIGFAVGAAGGGLLLIGVLAYVFWYLWAYNSPEKAERNLQRQLNFRNANSRTLADDEAELENHDGLLKQSKQANGRWYEEKRGSSAINVPDLVDIVVAGGRPPAEDGEEDANDDVTKRKMVFNNPLFSGDEEQKEDPSTVIPQGLVSAMVRRASLHDRSAPPTSPAAPASPPPLKVPVTLTRQPVGLDLGMYPGAPYIKRGQVRVRDWSLPQPNYTPFQYTAPDVLNNVDADPQADFVVANGLKFNAVDHSGVVPVDRTSHLGSYRIVGNLPCNPFGRTGLTGRGCLIRWGPNHAVQIILTRLACAPSGDTLMRAGLPVMEVAVVKRNNDRDTAAFQFPEGIAKYGKKVPDNLREALGPRGLINVDLTARSAQDIVNEVTVILDNGVELLRGVNDDLRNTDNSWVELVSVSFHDTTGALANYPLGTSDLDGATWMMASKEAELPATSRALLQQIVEKHGAFWTEKMMGEMVSMPSDTFSNNLVYNPPIPGMATADAAIAASNVLPSTPIKAEFGDNLLMSADDRFSRSSTEFSNATASTIIPAAGVPLPPPSASGLSFDSADATYVSPTVVLKRKQTAENDPTASLRRSEVLDAAPPPLPERRKDSDRGRSDSIAAAASAAAAGARASTFGESVASMDSSAPRHSSVPADSVSEETIAAKKSSRRKASARAKKSSRKKKEDKSQPAVTRPKEGFIAIYEGQYIGSVSTTNSGGLDEVLTCIKTVMASPAKEQPKILLVVSAEGVDVEEAGAPDPATGSTIVATPGKLLRHIPIRQLAFVKEDSKHKKVVGFIASDPKTGLLLCHVFSCEPSGLAVAEAITKSFKLAAQLRTDPFAVSRDGAETPEAITPAFKKLQLSRPDLKVRMIIGHGQYGKVYLATQGNGNNVAVKLIKVDASEGDEADFIGEALMLLNFDHPKLLKLMGVCLEKKPWLLVTEYMQYKDLGVVLRQCYKHDIPLFPNELLTFAVQVAEGIEYLSEKRFVHRDIAARNVLLDSLNSCRIADFGLTRKLPDGQDFWKLDKAGRLPVKYMSIEALTLKRFSAASDVWAFGVFLWELLSYADVPWESEGVANTEVRQALVDGKRLSCPQFLPAVTVGDDINLFTFSEEMHARIFAMAEKSWAKEIADRPTISSMRADLQAMLAEAENMCDTARDVGLLCYRTLESQRGRKGHGERGGSMIKSKALQAE